MKKKKIIITLILLVVFIKKINALEITDNSIIKYKWYKIEQDEGIYFNKSTELEGYTEDKSKIITKYVTDWTESYCTYPEEDNYIEKSKIYVYKKPIKTKYIKLTNLSGNSSDITNIKVYNGTTEIKYYRTTDKNNEIILSLNNNYQTEDIWLYIDSTQQYRIIFSPNESFVNESVNKLINNQQILIPDKSWLTLKTEYYEEKKLYEEEKKELTELIKANDMCKLHPYMTYRYKERKVYYDDNYYEYIEGYIKDESDYIIEYQNVPPIKEITITKEIPIKEYIYLNTKQKSENTNIKSINNQLNTISTSTINNIEKIKTNKIIPKKILIYIGCLLMIIVLDTYIICKKCRLK